WLREQLPDLDKVRGAANQLPHDYTCPQAIRTALPEALYSTAYIRDRAVDYLQDEARQEAPFFAFVSFPDPHHPFTPPGKYWDQYQPEDMPVPESFSAHRNPPPHLQWVLDQPIVGGAGFHHTPTRLTRRQAQEAMALSCGMISMIDDAVGDILKTLEAQGLADNTIVIFNSDHGDYLGDHGILFKGGLHFQSLIRVAMLWHDPRREQVAKTNVLCSTVDLAPTILAQAGITPYHGMQGVDFSALLNGQGDNIEREQILVEEDTYATDILGFTGQIRARTLVTRRYRLTVYQGVDWGELYDLQKDPLESRNLWDSRGHAALRKRLLWQLLQMMMGYADSSPWPRQEA
ncbi:MAG: sulfatase-like hydrolase/transferase, partial [Thiothrix sp.]|nr:sulfatase-like hydrolase/transferase [Thiothrix sp.]